MAATQPSAKWLTQDAYDRLTAELEHLTGPGRLDVVERIAKARDEGDLKENGGYHAAREEQGKMEARIRDLTALLKHAVVGETPPDDGVVEPGMLVTASLGAREITFLLGSREMAAGTDLQVYSESSPLGEAIVGLKVGDKTEYHAPTGAMIPVTIVAAKPFEG